MATAGTLLTVGHSNLALADFLALLKAHGVRRLVDVRLYPGSRRHPWFAGAALAQALEREGIAYTHAPGLGGRRRPRPDSPNTGWRNEQFRGYADHLSSPEFQAALEELNRLLPQGPVAVMCAESVPWRCHRSLLSDAELARGVAVEHIMSKGPTRPHALTRFARIDRGQDPPLVTYPPEGADAEQEQLL